MTHPLANPPLRPTLNAEEKLTFDPRIESWRIIMALQELDQAIEFYAGRRDETFCGAGQEVLPLLRVGAIRGCVSQAIKLLRPGLNVQPDKAEKRAMHATGQCDDLCLWCNPQEYD